MVIDWQMHGFYTLGPQDGDVKTYVRHIHGETAPLGIEIDIKKTKYMITDNDKELDACLKFGAMSQQLVVCFGHKGLGFPSARANENLARIMQLHINNVQVGPASMLQLQPSQQAIGASPSSMGSESGASPQQQAAQQVVAPPKAPPMVPRNLFGSGSLASQSGSGATAMEAENVEAQS
eukprot:6492718-Amphidinium_carterae.2